MSTDLGHTRPPAPGGELIGPPAGRWARTRPAPQSRALGLARQAFGIVEGTEAADVASRDAALRRLLVLADVLAALAALVLTVHVIGDDRLALPSLLIVPLVVMATVALRLHHRDEVVLAKTTLNEVPTLFHLATLYAFLVYVGQTVFIDGAMGPSQGLGLWAAFLVCSVGCRVAVRRLALSSFGPERCLVVGDRSSAEEVRGKLDAATALHADVVAAVSPTELPRNAEARAVLAALVRDLHVHRVIVAAPELDDDQLLAFLRDVKALGVKVSIRPRMLDVIGSAVEFDDIHGSLFLGVRRFGLNRTQRRVKRAMDLAGSTLLLLASAPLFLAFAIAIKLDTRGPVFFRQVRVGRDGERFAIWKFRTMVADAEERKPELLEQNEADGLFKLEDDPRVTRVGRLLRRTSLDELPQLFNVVAGQMSLVGPRPLVTDEDERIQGWHRRRLHLVPGMTGMWQVLGSARIPLHEMVALDYLYIVNWSLWNDVQILLRTIPFVVNRRGL